MIELLVVIVIIGIIAASLSFDFAPNRLQLAADQLIKDIRFTQSLALKDDKYQPFPESNSSVEQNQSKYWFKQWWQIKFTNANGNIIYYIFSDKADTNCSNFNKKIIHTQYAQELAKNGEEKYKIGISSEETNNTNYPNIKDIEKALNLTKTYGIVRIEYDGYSPSSMPNNMGNRINLLFDNNGNVFQNEGIVGDGGDINPLDSNTRYLLNQVKTIKLCNKLDASNHCLTDNQHCIAISISPSGDVEQTTCY